MAVAKTAIVAGSSAGELPTNAPFALPLQLETADGCHIVVGPRPAFEVMLKG